MSEASFYRQVLRPLLFRLDPEVAHKLGLWAVANGWVKATDSEPSLDAGKTLFGVKFAHPVGLAAGFDKDGVALDHWADLGFSFVEVGTVTRHPQPGNLPPRLFRLVNDRALINRMGFNNEGADACAQRLDDSDSTIPVGINIGKSKVTPIEEADQDYAYSFRLLAPRADYVVVNVSSPNTPGLRGLQDKEPLLKILSALKDIDTNTPLFVKVAPDLSEAALADVADVVQTLGLTGIVATNTTLSRPDLSSDPQQEGGLSGAPLTRLSDQVIAFLRRHCDAKTVLIGVGGIMSVDDAARKLELGADLLQVYTGWVYGGPKFVPELVRGLQLSGWSPSPSSDTA